MCIVAAGPVCCHVHSSLILLLTLLLLLLAILQIHGSMPDPHARTTKPSPSLLRSLKSSATKGHLARTCTLEATGTGKLSNGNHQTVKWTPQVPTNTTWGDRLHFE